MRTLVLMLLCACATPETPPVPMGYPVSCEETLETCMGVAESQPPGRVHHDEVMCRIRYEECRRSR